jgi:hypothetical protein
MSITYDSELKAEMSVRDVIFIPRIIQSTDPKHIKGTCSYVRLFKIRNYVNVVIRRLVFVNT